MRDFCHCATFLTPFMASRFFDSATLVMGGVVIGLLLMIWIELAAGVARPSPVHSDDFLILV